MSFAVAQYQTARVDTASPAKVVVDLYRGAIRFLRQAEQGGREMAPAERGRLLGRAHAIVSELQATLDRDRAPALTEELDRLYDFVLFQITDANLKADPSELTGAIQVLETLEDAWRQIAERR